MYNNNLNSLTDLQLVKRMGNIVPNLHMRKEKKLNLHQLKIPCCRPSYIWYVGYFVDCIWKALSFSSTVHGKTEFYKRIKARRGRNTMTPFTPFKIGVDKRNRNIYKVPIAKIC